MREFAEHTEAATTVEFHPHEFLLASGSADKTVHFWDLESFQLVSSTEPESSAIRYLAELHRYFMHENCGAYCSLSISDVCTSAKGENVYLLAAKMF